MATVVRFHNQPYWEREGGAADRAAEIEGPIRLESVADHSWKVADAILTVIDHFPWVDRCKAIELALLHDKLELITGDLSPIDAAGTGESTHAFNQTCAQAKREMEQAALNEYAGSLRPKVRRRQESLLKELQDESSDEARLVKAVDKLSSLTFVIQAKRGNLEPQHVDFTLAYSGKALESFPSLRMHYDVLVDLFLQSLRAPSLYPPYDATQHRALR